MIKQGIQYKLDVHISQLDDIRTEALRVKEQLSSEKFDVAVSQFDSTRQWAILRARNEKTSGHFDL